jgi:hypothetical protein
VRHFSQKSRLGFISKTESLGSISKTKVSTTSLAKCRLLNRAYGRCNVMHTISRLGTRQRLRSAKLISGTEMGVR